MKKKYYVAYGSNLNKRQMDVRCPDAVALGTGKVKDYQLLFRGRRSGAVATIEPKKGSNVPVAVWEISARDEERLDFYEGYPHLYYKDDLTVQLDDGSEIVGMVYLMTPGKELGRPTDFYFQAIAEGYSDFGFDVSMLKAAVKQSQSHPAAFEKIEKWANKQVDDFIPCPRCGRTKMKRALHHNALSRRADIYICDDCGTEEALNDFFQRNDTILDWYAVKH